MAIEKVSWDQAGEFLHGLDLHLLRNGITGPRLDAQMIVISDNDVPYTVQQLDVAKSNSNLPVTHSDYYGVRFVPRVVYSYNSPNYSFNGVTLNIITGQITATAPGSGQPSMKSFIIDVYLYKVNGANSDPVPPPYGVSSLRVHLHNSVTTVSLSPSTITIRPNINTSRFSVYAKFDDNTIGDISTHPGVVWNSNQPTIVSVSPEGFLTVLGSQPPTVVINATLPNYLGNTNSSIGGSVNIESSWQNTLQWPSVPFNAVLVPGSIGNSSSVINSLPNVLILPDGFDAADEAKFNEYTLQIHRQLCENSGSSPWDFLFKSSMNLWRAFVPSRQSGGTLYGKYVTFEFIFSTGEVANQNNLSGPASSVYVDGHGEITISIEEYIIIADNYLRKQITCPYYNIPTITNITEFRNQSITVSSNPLTSGQFTLHQLIELVGLPVPSDALNTVTLSSKVAEWQSLFSPNFSVYNAISAPNGNVPEDLFEIWRAMSNWRLLEERDTVFGLACGSRPRHSVDTGDNSRVIGFNNRRVNRLDINPLLQNLTNNGIGTVGVWHESLGSPQKDFDLVIFLSRGAKTAGANYTRLLNSLEDVMMGVTTSAVTYFQVNNLNNREVLIPSAPPELPIRIHSTLAHELAHSFSIGDEYGRNDFPPTPDARTVNKIQNSYNLMLDADVKSGGVLNGDLIKWRMPRIQKSGIITGGPTPSGNDYIITVKDLLVMKLLPLDIVYIRDWNTLPPNAPVPGTQFPNPRFSSEYEVVQVGTNNNVTIKLKSGSPPVQNTSWVGKLLICPVPDPSGGKFELLSKIVRLHISNSNKANFYAYQNPDDVLGNLIQDPKNPANLPSNPTIKRPKSKSLIVGLFEGGGEYKTGVFHPTGLCAMRSKPADNTSYLVDFCPVCGYSLIDQIDPSQHMFFDKLIRKRFPKT